MPSKSRKDSVGLGPEVMSGPGSIPTGGNIFHWIFFCFHIVKPLMPILALFPILFNYEKHRIGKYFVWCAMRLKFVRCCTLLSNLGNICRLSQMTLLSKVSCDSKWDKFSVQTWDPCGPGGPGSPGCGAGVSTSPWMCSGISRLKGQSTSTSSSLSWSKPGYSVVREKEIEN